MKKRFGILAISLPAAFAVGCNLDTGIKVSWTVTGGCPTGAVIQIKGTSTSGAAARESCGTTSGASCIAGSQVIACSAATVTILNWASGNWNITVNLLGSTDTYGASPLATAALTGKTVTEGQITDLGSVTLTSGGGGTTSVNVTVTFESGASCTGADLTGTAGAGAQCRGLRYKLTCGSNVFRNTNGDATPTTDQVNACGATATASNSNFAGSGSCTLEAQLVSATAACSGTAPSTWEHCDYYGTASVTVTAGQANNISVNTTKMSPGATPCPLTKPW
ncbi:MAG: hypothetical protein HYY84_09055 [Deltaproteobacteria bacterium]|nr:hypothetical protein [Deltaproteobacteria bacterium]